MKPCIRSWKRLGSLNLISAVLIGVISCSNPAATNDPSGAPQVSTKAWTGDGAGWVQWYTNDSSYLLPLGYSEWKWYLPNEATTSSVDVKLKKLSGASLGYGVIFGVQDASNFLTVLIDTSCHYAVLKKVYDSGAGKAVDTQLYPTNPAFPYDTSANLNAGYAIENEIRIDYKAGTSSYDISFNGNPVECSIPTAAYPFTGGMSGFIVNVGTSSDENFPDEPVDIRFKRLAPSPAVP